MQLFERQEVRGDVLADRRVRAASRLHRANAVGRQGLVSNQKLAVLPREDVVRHDREAHAIPQAATKREHERRLAAAHRPADAHREGALAEVARERAVALVKPPRVFQVLVRVPVIVPMSVGMAVHVSLRGIQLENRRE